MATNPYAYNLPTSFQNTTGTLNGNNGFSAYGYDTSTSSDPDVQGAQSAYNQGANPNAGTSLAEQNALYNMYQGRIQTKNALGSQINADPTLQMNSAENLMNTADQAEGQGLQSTRENFARRGLLYSGAREGAEEQVRSNAGTALSSSLAGNTQDFQNSLKASQNAYANVDLAGGQQSLDLANQAYQTASANNIARMQALQQLGGGLGAGAGAVAGSQSNNSSSTTNPVSGFYGSPYFSGNYDYSNSYANTTGAQQPTNWFYGNSPNPYSQPVERD